MACQRVYCQSLGMSLGDVTCHDFVELNAGCLDQERKIVYIGNSQQNENGNQKAKGHRIQILTTANNQNTEM